MDEMDLLGEDCSMTDADPIAAVPGKKEKKKKEKCEIIHMSTCRLCASLPTMTPRTLIVAWFA